MNRGDVITMHENFIYITERYKVLGRPRKIKLKSVSKISTMKM